MTPSGTLSPSEAAALQAKTRQIEKRLTPPPPVFRPCVSQPPANSRGVNWPGCKNRWSQRQKGRFFFFFWSLRLFSFSLTPASRGIQLRRNLEYQPAYRTNTTQITTHDPFLLNWPFSQTALMKGRSSIFTSQVRFGAPRRVVCSVTPPSTGPFSRLRRGGCSSFPFYGLRAV